MKLDPNKPVPPEPSMYRNRAERRAAMKKEMSREQRLAWKNRKRGS